MGIRYQIPDIGYRIPDTKVFMVLVLGYGVWCFRFEYRISDIEYLITSNPSSNINFHTVFPLRKYKNPARKNNKKLRFIHPP